MDDVDVELAPLEKVARREAFIRRLKSYLRSHGWKEISNTPGWFRAWTKEMNEDLDFTSGLQKGQYVCDMESALYFERSLSMMKQAVKDRLSHSYIQENLFTDK